MTGEPDLRVVRGDPSAEELAAVVGALLAVRRRADAPVRAPVRPPVWTAPPGYRVPGTWTSGWRVVGHRFEHRRVVGPVRGPERSRRVEADRRVGTPVR